VGYSSLPIWRYLHYLWIANHGRVYPHARLSDDLTAQGLWTWRSPLVDLLSVSTVIAPHDRPIDDKGWARVFTGSDGVDVWHNRRAYPRGFMVYRAINASDEPDAARRLADPSFSPAGAAILEVADPRLVPLRADEVAPPPTQAEVMLREDAHHLSFEVIARAAGVLVVTEPWYPGWSATVDGVPVDLLRVDYALRGVVLTPGRHVVSLTYFNKSLAWGGALSILGLLLVAGLSVVRRARSRV
jgi:hypothetical protein